MQNSKIPKESRYWHLRINDFSTEQLDYIKSAINLEWCIISNIEKDDTAKAAHVHVAIKFKHAITRSVAFKRLIFNQALHSTQFYLEPKYNTSTKEQFVNYVIKNGYQYKQGEPPFIIEPAAVEGSTPNSQDQIVKRTKKQIEKEAADKLFNARWEAAKIGDINWFIENDRKFMMSAHFGRLMVNAQPDINENLESIEDAFIYIYGAPGTGKSSSIDFLYPKCYRKLKNNEKWDSYYTLKPEHKVVYFDELDSYEELELCMGGIAGLKEKCDIYPFPIRQNYGSRQIMIRPEKIIFTSNFTPRQIFAGSNKYGRKLANIEMITKAFYRRFKVYHINDWLALNHLKFNAEIKRIERVEDVHFEIKPNNQQHVEDYEEKNNC